jgi:hypothetical protein
MLVFGGTSGEVRTEHMCFFHLLTPPSFILLLKIYRGSSPPLDNPPPPGKYRTTA